MATQLSSHRKLLALSFGAVVMAGFVFAGCNKNAGTSTTTTDTTGTTYSAPPANSASTAPGAAMQQQQAPVATAQPQTPDQATKNESDSLNKLDVSAGNIDKSMNDQPINVN